MNEHDDRRFAAMQRGDYTVPNHIVQKEQQPAAQDYVVGYAFRHDYGAVALIEKRKPAWQAGKLNGVGGKIEPGETPLAAMVREFEEEAGVRIQSWMNFRTEQFMHTTPSKSDQYVGTRVYHFATLVLPEMWQFVRTMEQERIIKLKYPQLDMSTDEEWFVEHLIYNLPYLIPMAATLLQQPPENRPVP